MPKVYWLTVHERAPAHDARNPTLRALLNRGLRHAPLTKRAVKPHAADLALHRLLDYLKRHRRMRRDHDAIEVSRDTGEGWIAGDTFDLGGVRVHRQRFIPTVTELPKHRVGSAVGPARHAGYGDSLSVQKLSYGLWDVRHMRLHWSTRRYA
jgi:hypothetical protein